MEKSSVIASHKRSPPSNRCNATSWKKPAGVRLALVVSAALLALSTLSGSGSVQAAEPETNKKETYLYITPDGPNLDCAGQNNTPICAAATLQLCSWLHDNDLCEIVGVFDRWKPHKPKRSSSDESMSYFYRHLARYKRVVTMDKEMIAHYYADVDGREGDVLIELEWKSCDFTKYDDPSQCPPASHPRDNDIYVFRKKDGNWKLVAFIFPDKDWCHGEYLAQDYSPPKNLCELRIDPPEGEAPGYDARQEAKTNKDAPIYFYITPKGPNMPCVGQSNSPVCAAATLQACRMLLDNSLCTRVGVDSGGGRSLPYPRAYMDDRFRSDRVDVFAYKRIVTLDKQGIDHYFANKVAREGDVLVQLEWASCDSRKYADPSQCPGPYKKSTKSYVFRETEAGWKLLSAFFTPQDWCFDDYYVEGILEGNSRGICTKRIDPPKTD